MPIEVVCAGCKRRLRVPDKAAGKRIKCPKCQAAINVPDPAAGLSGTLPDNWYFKTETGDDYGPVPKSELDQWKREGRVNADCQVLREGSDQWQWATDLYPDLQETAPAPAAGGFDPLGGQPTGYEMPAGELAAAPFTAPSAPAFSAAPSYSSASSYSSSYSAGGVSSRKKLVAGLLGIFLGSVGVHRFYLGFTGIGIAQILVTFFTCGMGGWWGVIEGILILTGSMNQDAEGRILQD